MSDLISRQAAIEALGEQPLAWEHGEYEEGLIAKWESDVEAIKNLPSAQSEQRWIPCSERLPKTDNWRTEYMVTCDRGYEEDTKLETTCMSWENTTVRGKPVSRWIWHDRLSPWKVVAWMEKPEPWKGNNR